MLDVGVQVLLQVARSGLSRPVEVRLIDDLQQVEAGYEGMLLYIVRLARDAADTDTRTYVASEGGYHVQRSAMHMHVYALLVGWFSSARMLEGLGALSEVIVALRRAMYLRAPEDAVLAETPLHSVRIETIDLSAEEQSSLWRTLGVCYRPSVLCRIGRLPLVDVADPASVAAVRTISY